MTEQKGATTILCLCRIKQFRNKDIQFLTRYLINDIIITKRYKQIDQCLKYSKIKWFRFINSFKWVWHDIFPPPPPLLRDRILYPRYRSSRLRPRRLFTDACIGYRLNSNNQQN